MTSPSAVAPTAEYTSNADRSRAHGPREADVLSHGAEVRRKSVVLLDLWTDANRGDCALQSGLISMARHKWSGAEIFGVFRFGTNEMDTAAEEVRFTIEQLDGYCGGLRRTYYSAHNHGRLHPMVAKLVSLLSFVEMFLFVLLFKLKLTALLPRGKREVLERVSSADVVLWKGKNFREYGGLGGINRQFTLLSAGFLGGALSRNLHCVNASVWPMKNAVERFLVRKAFARCKSITVREPASLQALQLIGLRGVDVRFAQDLSFYCLRDSFSAVGRKRVAASRDYDVALTITQWGSGTEQRAYVDTLRQCILALMEAGARKFVIVPQVTRAAEDNSKLVVQLKQIIPAQSVLLDVIPGSPSIGELLDVYERCALLVGTRMHSCVFAMSVGTPFLGIAYDAGPKWDILKQFWPEEFLFEYGSVSERVAQAASKLYRHSNSVVPAASDRFAALAELSYENVKAI